MNVRRMAIGVALVAASLAFPAVPALAASGSPSPEQVHANRVGSTLGVPPVAVPAGVSTSTRAGVTTLAAAGYVITCKPDAQNPHISSGASERYVIYKTRVACTGTGSYPSRITIRVRGALMWDSARYSGDTSNGIAWSALRTSDETRIVSVNGSLNTFYTPKLGTSGAYFTGHYQGSSTVEILSPVGQTVGSDISTVVFLAP